MIIMKSVFSILIKLYRQSFSPVSMKNYRSFHFCLLFVMINQLIWAIPFHFEAHPFPLHFKMIILILAVGFAINYTRRISSLGLFLVNMFFYFGSDDFPKLPESYYYQIIAFCFLGESLIKIESDKLQFSFWPESDRNYVFGIGISIVKIALISMYCGAILVKLNPWYLSGMQLYQLFMMHHHGSDAILIDRYRFYFQALAIFVIAVEFFLVTSLCIKSFRNVGVVIGIFFHLVLLLALPVKSLSIMVIGMLLCFYEFEENHAKRIL